MIAAIVLIAFGIFRFVKPRAHSAGRGCGSSERELGAWSFLMSTTSAATSAIDIS